MNVRYLESYVYIEHDFSISTKFPGLTEKFVKSILQKRKDD